MQDLTKVKEVIKENFPKAAHGIFNTRNWAGDEMETLYEGNGITVDICRQYEYFEVLGVDGEEWVEIIKHYDSLRNTKTKLRKREG